MRTLGKKFTIEDAKKFVRENSDSELLETEWKGSQEKIRFRCSCGAEFITTYNRFQNQNKRQCFACASKRAYDQKRLRIQEVIDLIQERSDCTYLSGEYKNQKSKLLVRCGCGAEFRVTLNNLISKHGSGRCPSCGIAMRNRFSKLDLERVREVALSRGAELISDEYINAHTELTFRCECGDLFTTTFNRFTTLGKTRCRKCSKRESKGEREVRMWLQEQGIQFVAQKAFNVRGDDTRPYYFDFYLPDYNTCIEFDGAQHFRPTAFASDDIAFQELKARDEAKTKFCAENGIRLIRIPYWNMEYVDMILESTLIPR